MKKIMILMAAILLLIAVNLYARAITDELNTWWASKTATYDDPNTVKADLQNACWSLNENLARLQEAYDAGKFDNFPPVGKAKAIWIYQQLNAAKTAIANDPGAMELLDWRPIAK